MIEPRFSVIINVHNGARFLREAIDSVLAQTFSRWELLLWDDGSTDDSAAICRSYQDDRIRAVIHDVNAGLGHARNAAIALARGDWIAFLDQDDVWLPEKLARQDALILADHSGQLGMVYGRALRFEASGRQRPFDSWYGSGPLPQGAILEQLLAKPSFVPFSAAVFSAERLRQLGPIPATIQFCPDYYLTVAFARNFAAACVQETCCHYRVHGDSMSHVYRRRIHEDAIRVVETLSLPGQIGLVRRRRRVHQTWIGLEHLRDGKFLRGVAHILRHGSLAYLALRPAVVAARALREFARGRRLPLVEAVIHQQPGTAGRRRRRCN